MTTENLFAPSAIKLFGREFKGLSVNQPLTGDSPPLEARARVPIDKIQEKLEHRQGYRQAPGRLERALRKVAANEKDESKNHARFARIYGFSYEGQYYELPRPVLFLVYGPGKEAEFGDGFTVQSVGVAAKDWKFASDIMVWEVDDKDVSMCIDIESGPMKEILLRPMFDIEETEGATAGRGAAASRGAAAGRGAAVARGAAITRDPHRNR